MSDTIRFNIKLNIDGKDVVVQASESVKELQKNLRATKSSADKARASILGMNQVTEIFGNINNSLSSLKSSMDAFTGVYNNAVQAETKLVTVMRQRMGANEDMVSSVNKVIAEQTKLGVVGGTVQKSGAQQMATFLNEASSLRTLIPAMDDLLTQQRGINATSEDAISVANLMGKAMQGQTTALKRVGITFTDAQAEVMKYGTESQRAAMLAEIITDNVGHMNAALAATDAGKVKQASNELGGMASKIGAILSPYQTLINQFAMFGMAVSSVFQVGSALVSLTKALGLTTIAAKSLNTIWAWGTKNIQVLRTAVVEYNIAQTMESKGALAAAASTTLFKVALKGLLVATGIGIAIVALSTAFDLISGSSDKASKSVEDFNQTTEDTTDVASEARAQIASQVGAYQQAIASVTKFKGTKDEEKKIVEKLNSTYGDTFGTYNTAADWYATLTKYSQAYTNQLYNQAKMQILVNKAAANDLELEDLEKRHPELKGSDATINGKKVRLANTSNYKVDTKSDRPDYYGTGKPLTFEATGERTTLSDGRSVPVLRDYVKRHTQLVKQQDELHSSISNLQKEMDKEKLPVPHKPSSSGSGTTVSSPKVTRNTPQVTNNENGKVFKEDAETTAEISDNISILQEKLSHTKPDSEAYKKINSELEGWKTKLDEINRGYESGSVADYEHQISKLDEAMHNLNLTETERNKLLAERDNLQQKVDAINDSVLRQGSISTLTSQLQKKQKDFDNATTDEERAKISIDISDLQSQIDEKTKGKLTIHAEVEPVRIEKGSAEDKLQSYQNAQSQSGKIQQMFDLKIVGADEAQRLLDKINEKLKELHIDPIKIEFKTEGEKSAEEAVKSLQGSFGGDFESITSQWEDMGKAFTKGGDAATGAGAAIASVGNSLQQIAGDGAAAKVGAIMASIGQLVLGYAYATSKAGSELGPFGWIGFAIAGAATLASIISQVSSFSTGGIVGGASYHGDKVPAKVNSGEMILTMGQQKRLFAIANGEMMPKMGLPTYQAVSPRVNTEGSLGTIPIDITFHGKTRGTDTLYTIQNVRRQSAKFGKRWD